MPLVKIDLTEEEVLDAMRHGDERHAESRRSSRRDRFGMKKEDRIDVDYVGAIGEQIVAKAIGIEPEFRIGNFKGPDLRGFIQVRATDNLSHSLIIRSNDNKDHVYALAYAVPDRGFFFGGWIWGVDGMSGQFWRSLWNGRPPVWLIDEMHLHPAESLVDLVEHEKRAGRPPSREDWLAMRHG